MTKTEYYVPALHIVMQEYFAGPQTQRFGQWFVNRCLPDDITWPELFYEKNTAKAIAIVANWYAMREAE